MLRIDAAHSDPPPDSTPVIRYARGFRCSQNLEPYASAEGLRLSVELRSKELVGFLGLELVTCRCGSWKDSRS